MLSETSIFLCQMAGQRMQLHPCNALDFPFRRITWKATFIYQSCETTKLDCVSSFIPVLIKKSGHSDGLVPRDDRPFPLRGLKVRVPNPPQALQSTSFIASLTTTDIGQVGLNCGNCLTWR